MAEENTNQTPAVNFPAEAQAAPAEPSEAPAVPSNNDSLSNVPVLQPEEKTESPAVPAVALEPAPAGEIILPKAESAPVPASSLPDASSSAAIVPAPIFGMAEKMKGLYQKFLQKIRGRTEKRLSKIMSLAAKKRKITNDDAQKLLRVSDATATRYLSQLVKQGRLKRQGSPKDAWYEPL